MDETTVISGAGLVEVELAGQVDTFVCASGEEKARQFGTSGYSIRANKGSDADSVHSR